MNTSVSKYADEAAVNVLVGDEISCQVTRAQARELKAAGTHFFVNHGKDLRCAGERASARQTEIEQSLGWRMPFGRMRSSALNEGRSGQFPIGYEIPYAWEGYHTKFVSGVKVTNASDPVHA